MLNVESTLIIHQVLTIRPYQKYNHVLLDTVSLGRIAHCSMLISTLSQSCVSITAVITPMVTLLNTGPKPTKLSPLS